jgi:hypothetical protein
MSDMSIEKLRQFSSCVEIVHHIPGRLRLRLLLDDLSESLLAGAQAFRGALDGSPGIRSIRVNALARSCTIEYDPREIPLEAWPDFLGGVESEAAAVLRQMLFKKIPIEKKGS